MNIRNLSKSLYSLVLVTLAPIISLSNVDSTKTKSLKLYSNLSVVTEQSSISIAANDISTVNKKSQLNLGSLTPAFTWGLKNGRFHEVEISEMNFNRNFQQTSQIDFGSGGLSITEGERVYNLSLAMRYEYSVYSEKRAKKSKLVPALGGSIQPYFHYIATVPAVATRYRTGLSSFGAVVNFIPRVYYNMNKKWFLDLNIPLTLAKIGGESSTVENSLIRDEDQRVTNFNLDFVTTDILVRFGVGMRI